MRAYLVDEILSDDMVNIRAYLKENTVSSQLDQVFWAQIPDDLLSADQLAHKNCRPHVFAVELGEDWVKCEFLIRSLPNMQCTCPAYAGRLQRRHILSFADNMIRKLGVKT